MAVAHRVSGSSSQQVTCQLEAGQSIYAEPGKFLWKTTNVALETRLSRPGASAPEDGSSQSAGSKLLKMAMDVGKRVVAGESMALQYFTATGGAGLVGFSGLLPGEVRAIELDGTTAWRAAKATLIAAEATVDFDIAFTGLRAGYRGGLGFVLERFSGTGTLFLAAAGSFVSVNPASYAGKIQVDTGTIVAFQDSLQFGVEHIGGLSGQTAMAGIFGGEGINLATLEGDGEVLLQSTTLEGLERVLAQDPRPADQRSGGPL